MSQFATPDDLATRLGITLTDDEWFRADSLLTDASALIADEVGQTIDLVTDDVYTRPGTYDNRILLPQRPVVSISSITARLLGNTDFPIADDSWYIDGDELVRAAFPLGIERHFFQTGNGWLGPTFTLTITYTHGYATIPQIAKSVCLEAVVRVWGNPGGVAQESAGDTSTLYRYPSDTPDPPGLLLSRAELKMLRNKFERSATSLSLR